MNPVSVEYTSLKSSDIFSPVGSHTKYATLQRSGIGGINLKQPSNINFSSPLGDLTFTNIIIYIFIIAIIIIVIIRIFSPNMLEGMSGGTLTQLFAQDSQNNNINSASPGIQSGDFDLYFNNPTHITNGGTQRGSPMPKIALPDTDMSPMKNQDNQVAPNEQIIPCSMEHPEACGNGKGNINYLKNGFVQPSDEPTSYVGLNGKIMYPTGYLGSLYVSPQPDLMKPHPVMQKDVSMTSKPYLPYVKEGYE